MLVSVTTREHRLRLIHTYGKGQNEELTHWIDLATGRMHKVQLRPSTANPQRVTINPNPNLGAPGILTMD